MQNWAEEGKGLGLAWPHWCSSASAPLPRPGFLTFAVKSQLKESFRLFMLCLHSSSVSHPPLSPSSIRSLVELGRHLPTLFMNDAYVHVQGACIPCSICCHYPLLRRNISIGAHGLSATFPCGPLVKFTNTAINLHILIRCHVLW